MNLCPILYIEDEENDVLFMRRALAESGIPNPLHVVPDGKQAIAYLRNAPAENYPCFVLLDLNLPLVSGFEVLDWIRQQPNSRDLPVFVLSSSNQASDVQRATELGATSYVVKPASPSKLVEVVREIQSKWHRQEHA
jgi:CheY-like chemotaxis protein